MNRLLSKLNVILCRLAAQTTASTCMPPNSSNIFLPIRTLGYSRGFSPRGGRLDAALLQQNYLRLAIDCNRAPTSERPDMIFGTDRCKVFWNETSCTELHR